ncbi:MAG TPA: BACON domain-containing carbohydrate-binding protein [Candidatus Acidoferrum sp.]|nr:BACON domain-containing carbohydrate-binding protein [Candidatus Acidoferrum sp.]
MLGNRTFTIVQAGVVCNFTATPTSRNHGHTNDTRLITIDVPSGCAWPATSSSLSWITFQPPTNTIGSGTLTYVIAANPSSILRSGQVIVAGQTVTLSQDGAPCSYVFSTNSMVHNGSTEEEATIPFTAPAGCAWNVSVSDSWIEIFSALSGSGNNAVTYIVPANPSTLSRTGYVHVGTAVLSVTQHGRDCEYHLSATNSPLLSSAPSTSSFSVSTFAGCNWGASTSDSWIQILAGGTNSGNGLVQFAVITNSLAATRTGVITAAGQTFFVVQGGASCTYEINPPSATLVSSNVTAFVSVKASNGCTWFVTETNDWISIKSGGQGTNNGLVNYTLGANPSPNPRTANIVIADKVFAVTQLGSSCTYTLSSTGRLHGSLFESNQVTVVAVTECTWSIDNTNGWIQFPDGTNGYGTLAIPYTVQANPNSVDRVGHFWVGNQKYTVRQFGSECSYALLANSVTHGGLSEGGTISVNTPIGCTWSIVETNTWITMQSPLSQTNSNTVSYTVSVNVSGAPRTGVIRIEDQSFTVTQAAVVCSFNVSLLSYNHGFEVETNAISVVTSNVCPWTVSKSNSWINLISLTNQTGSTNFSYYVSANPSSTPRTGVVMVAGQPVTLRQTGLQCDYLVEPTFQAHGYRAETNEVTVTCPSLCSWGVSETESWITIETSASNVGSGKMRYRLNANLNTTPRTGTIVVDGHSVVVTQNGVPFIVASNKTVQCNTAWNFDSPLPTGNCQFSGASIFVVSTGTNYGCGSTFVATRVWDATDACGVHIMATQVVSVVSPPPIITCPSDKNVECGNPWTFNAPTAIDFCSGASLNGSIRVLSTATNNVGMCGNTLSITRTWEVADACSNKVSCSQTVNIVDTTPPMVACAANKTVQCGAPWSFDQPSGSDTCGTNIITIRPLSTGTNFTAGCGYTAQRIWELLDSCGNVSTCTQTVTAVDTIAPVLTCPQAKTVECGSPWSFDFPSATDNCGTNVLITVIGTATNTSGSCGSAFTATRTWQAIDPCGNANFCSQTVVVIDTTAPIVAALSDRTVEFGNSWSFDTPSGTDACGGTNLSIRNVGTSTNWSGFCGPTFSATRVWEIADGCSNKVTRVQIVTVRDTTPPQIACVADKTVTCESGWTFDTPTAVDVASGTPVSVVFVGIVTNGTGTCSSDFSATCTWRATDLCGNSATCSQTVFARAIVNVAGTVYVPTNFPATLSDKRVPGATILAPTNSLTAADGAYSSTFGATTNVTLTPLAPATGKATNGVSSIDISLIQAHILSILPLGSPYKLLTADVDGSGTVDTVDLLSMRRVVLGSTNRLPRGLWRFVPSDYAFPNPQTPWNAPTNRVYSNLFSNLSGQNFLALRLGDVNNSWAPGSDEGSGGSGGPGFTGGPGKSGTLSTPVVAFAISNATGMPGTSVVVHVTANGFRRVTSVQGTFTWNPSVIRFAGTTQFGVAGFSANNFGTNQAGAGSLTFSWHDPSATTATLDDGSTIFALRFDVIGALGSSSLVQLGDSITLREAGVDFTPAVFQTTDGFVNVANLGATRVTFNMHPGAAQLVLQTVPGRTYFLEYSPAVPSTNWTALPGVMGNGQLLQLTDPNPTGAQRFYRVRIQ